MLFLHIRRVEVTSYTHTGLTDWLAGWVTTSRCWLEVVVALLVCLYFMDTRWVVVQRQLWLGGSWRRERPEPGDQGPGSGSSTARIECDEVALIHVARFYGNLKGSHFALFSVLCFTFLFCCFFCFVFIIYPFRIRIRIVAPVVQNNEFYICKWMN